MADLPPVPWGSVHGTKTSLAILVLTALAALTVVTRPQLDIYATAVSLVTPRVQSGTLWLMAATLVVAQWYRVPIHPFHTALLTSFTAYMALYAALLTLINLHGWEITPYAEALDNSSFALAACWWAHAAWKRQSSAATAHVATLRKLQLSLVERSS